MYDATASSSMHLAPFSKRLDVVTHDGDGDDDDEAGDAAAPMPPPFGRRRYVIAVLSLWITTICYADRTNIGIAIPAFVDDKAQQGQVLAAFFYGYLLTQLPGGFLAARFGAKPVLLAGVVVWTLFDLATVLVSGWLPVLCLARVGMGLGEGILFPCMHQLASAWYPSAERSRLVAFVSGGSDLGTVVALIVSPVVMHKAGWPRIFELFAVVSFSWVLVFALYGGSRPETDRFTSARERAYITAHRSASSSSSSSASASSMNWRVLLTSRPAWAVYAAHFCHNYGWYVLLGWIPQYFRQALHLDLGTHGVTAALPYFCGYLGVLLFGRLGDALVARGVRVRRVRQTINAIAFFGSALCLFLIRWVTSAAGAVAMLSLTLFLGRAALAGYWVNMIDIAPGRAAHVMAVSNTIATVPGIVGNVVTGQILAATGRWDVVFAIAAAVLVVGGVVFHLWASDQSIYAAASDELEASRASRATALSSLSSSGSQDASLSRDEASRLLHA
ncbi:hypothetical protein ATCC90586_003619 [Pythium insidiosum]|nr:hypothetical protein ATCC90586_003619 [Pythium insidiosum]